MYILASSQVFCWELVTKGRLFSSGHAGMLSVKRIVLNLNTMVFILFPSPTPKIKENKNVEVFLSLLSYMCRRQWLLISALGTTVFLADFFLCSDNFASRNTTSDGV